MILRFRKGVDVLEGKEIGFSRLLYISVQGLSWEHSRISGSNIGKSNPRSLLFFV